MSEYDAEAVVWRYMFGGPFESADDLGRYLQRQVDAPNGTPWAVVDKTSSEPLGIVNLMNCAPDHLKVEIGSLWLSPLAQKSIVNTELMVLLADLVFEVWHFRRFEWKCDARNRRSQRAACRLGFVAEGVQDCHFIIKDRSRDTAWFRILDHEYYEAGGVKDRLDSLLAAAEAKIASR